MQASARAAGALYGLAIGDALGMPTQSLPRSQIAATKQAVSALLAGADPGQAGRNGTTNGAAMRITPVGIATPCADLDVLVDRVVEASRATHNTSVALAGAAAVAAAVSAGVDGAAPADAIRVAVAAAERAAGRGHWVAAADVASRITWATGLAAGLSTSGVIDVVGRLVGTSLATQESVPAAFAVVAASPDNPWLSCRTAASLGGDCDTIAAMAGAIGGACHGAGAFPDSARHTITRVNDLGLDELAGALLTLRAAMVSRPAAAVAAEPDL